MYLEALDIYVNLFAYAGESDDSLISGNWNLVWNDEMQLFALNNSAIPEPSSVAAILGAMSIIAAYARKRK